MNLITKSLRKIGLFAVLTVAACGWLSVSIAHSGEARDVEEKNANELAGLLGDETRDLELLHATHFASLTSWDHVQPANVPAAQKDATFHWRNEGPLVMPLDDGAIGSLVDVPETATFRVYLRHQLGSNTTVPVTLALTPQKVTEAAPEKVEAAATRSFTDLEPALTHVFGQVKLGSSMTGRELEKNKPLRFESETQLVAVPPDMTLVWEYWDVELKKGVYRASLSKADKRVRASALLLTRSKEFRPSLATSVQRTIGRIYMRFKVDDPGAKRGTKFTVDASLSYHFGPRASKSNKEGVWSWNIGNTAPSSVGEWSPFIEATEAAVPGTGPWSTCNLSVKGVQSGNIEVQLAWFPHERAVDLSVKTGVGGGLAMLRVPNGVWTFTPQTGVAGWGMWNPVVLKQVMTQEAVIERYFTWAQQAAARLGLKDGHPMPKLIRLFCGCGVLPSNRERASEMLAKLGVSWIDGASESVVKKYGLHDETCAYNTADAAGLARGMSEAQRLKMTKIKIGDEIDTLMDPAAINSDSSKREGFHQYLKAQARIEGMDIPAFLGVEDLNNIDCLGKLSANPGRFERRLFYHSQCFGHLGSCDEYRAITQAFEKNFPNAHVYNNYSPHPVFLTGTTMNSSDWFVLPRHKAQTLGWAEDWATGGSWGHGSHYQCTSFFAALVECAVRKYGYPSGFYVGTNCGGSAEKIFGCVAEGVTWLHLYDWGPVDRWTDGSNAWSEHEGEYYSVLCAASAIGPADEIIAKGRREARRTAIVYNRSHEILHDGAGRMNHDWMWTFIGLKSSQIPVDVIIEEDLNADDLKRYDCIVLGGFNLSRTHMTALKKWVESGGLLIGTGGAAMYDIYDDPLPETLEVFGARQRLSGAKDKASVARVKFQKTELFPEFECAAGALTFLLEPTAGKSVANYGGGECAAVVNSVGKGQAILLGFQPGAAYRDNGRAAGNARAWLAAPFLKRLGRQRVEFDHHESEATLFEHDSGLAVMLASFGGLSPEGGSNLSVQTDRTIKEVVSALRGPLEWKRVGDRIEIKTRRLEPVDVVILK